VGLSEGNGIVLSNSEHKICDHHGVGCRFVSFRWQEVFVDPELAMTFFNTGCRAQLHSHHITFLSQNKKLTPRLHLSIRSIEPTTILAILRPFRQDDYTLMSMSSNSRSHVCLLVLASMALFLIQLDGTFAFSVRPAPSTSRASFASSRFVSVGLSRQEKLSFESQTIPSDMDNEDETVRTRLRSLTGFSMTALRATMRAVTGVSLTAVYASTCAATGAWIRQTMKVILNLFPSWARYFVQPFLVLYYVPLYILRNRTNRHTRKDALSIHNTFVEGRKHAMRVADGKMSYWPLHVNAQGEFESDFDGGMDLKEAIEQSVQVSLEEEE
jgi:hypothetical protein